METLAQLTKEWEECQLIKMFEVEVINKKTNEKDYILFDVSLDDCFFSATHEALTTEEKESNKIAFVAIEVDDCFSLDQNLQELYSACIDKIMESDFFKLSEES